MERSELIRAYIGAIIRALLIALAGSLALKNAGFLHSLGDYLNAHLPGLTNELTGLAITGGAVLWSLIRKSKTSDKVNTALALPENSTPAELKTALAAGGPVTILPSARPVDKETAAAKAITKRLDEPAE